MSDESTAPDATAASGGQDGGTPQGAGATSSGLEGGQAGDTGQGTATGNGQGGGGNVVFDPVEFKRLTDNLPDDLKAQAIALQKGYESAYTKKTQKLSGVQKKADNWEAFERDPHGSIRRIAQQLGYSLSGGPGGSASGQGPSGADGWNPERGDPDSWQDVTGYILGSVERKLGEMLNPVYKGMKTMRQNTIESQLNEIDPGWRTYEDQMSSILTKHPTLAEDVGTLYRLAVPPEVLESRATQRAIAKLESKARGGELAGSSTTTRRPKQGEPEKALSFSEAVKFAEKALAEQGLHPTK